VTNRYFKAITWWIFFV